MIGTAIASSTLLEIVYRYLLKSRSKLKPLGFIQAAVFGLPRRKLLAMTVVWIAASNSQ